MLLSVSTLKVEFVERIIIIIRFVILRFNIAEKWMNYYCCHIYPKMFLNEFHFNFLHFSMYTRDIFLQLRFCQIRDEVNFFCKKSQRKLEEFFFSFSSILTEKFDDSARVRTCDWIKKTSWKVESGGFKLKRRSVSSKIDFMDSMDQHRSTKMLKHINDKWSS